MKNIFDSKVEQVFYELSSVEDIATKFLYLEVDDFPKLGLMTSIHFLESAERNSQGVISLPTGQSQLKNPF